MQYPKSECHQLDHSKNIHMVAYYCEEKPAEIGYVEFVNSPEIL